MKRTLLYLLIILTGFASCRKDDDPIFDKSPDERLNEALAKYQQALVTSPYGWKATIVPANGGIYHYYFRFNDSNRVYMHSDFNLEAASELKSSSYRLKALQQPSLIFDTYSYLHYLSDPDGGVNGGPDGQGLKYDFEFSIDAVVGDSVKLTGRFWNSKLTLVKATQQDKLDWENKLWARSVAFNNITKIQNYFRRLTIGSQEYEVYVNPVTRTVTFVWYTDDGQRHSSTSNYSFGTTGVTLIPAFNDGNQVINGFTNVSWNESSETLEVTANGNTATIAGAIAPLKVDVDAPRRWRNASAAGQFSFSVPGFHLNGKDDAFGIMGTPSYATLGYFPDLNIGGTLYDAAAFVLEDADGLFIGYGAAYKPTTFTADGRVIFNLLGFFGADEIPPGFEEGVGLTGEYMGDPMGYYLVQTSATTYDMVSARDAKAWVTWTIRQ